MSFKITGTGSALPQQAVTNQSLSQFLNTSDQWIRTRTGIASRYICTEESVTQLAVQAAQNALKAAGTAPNQLDCIICATLGGDYITPSLGCMVQQGIGAVCPAFDVNAACSGFLYALELADSYFAAGKAQRILVVAAEGMSRLVDWQDRSTCVLFGDGAGAAVLAPGEGVKALRVGARGAFEPLSAPFPQGNSPFRPGQGQPAPCTLAMNGREIYQFAVLAMEEDIAWALHQGKASPEQVRWVVPHQANSRIIQAAAKGLPIPLERFAVEIGDLGNTSAASIPIVLDRLCRRGQLQKGELVVLSAFGAGLTTGVCLMEWGK